MLQRCRLGAAEEHPFACPDGCLFFEARVLETAGWAQQADKPMTNTAWGVAGITPPPRSSGKGRRRGRRQL